MLCVVFSRWSAWNYKWKEKQTKKRLSSQTDFPPEPSRFLNEPHQNRSNTFSSQINISSSLLSRTCKTLILVSSTVLHTTMSAITLTQEASLRRLHCVVPPCSGEGHSNRGDLLVGFVVSGNSATGQKRSVWRILLSYSKLGACLESKLLSFRPSLGDLSLNHGYCSSCFPFFPAAAEHLRWHWLVICSSLWVQRNLCSVCEHACVCLAACHYSTNGNTARITTLN